MVKQIKEYPNYGVNENGEVFNLLTNTKLKPWVSNGYQYVSLGRKNKKRVHRLVANAFIPNPQNLPVVNHLDENKLNNNVSNLEWCTHRDNVMYGEHAPAKNIRIAQELSKKKVVQCTLDGQVVCEYESIQFASEQSGVIRTSISHCCIGDYKSAGGFTWKYG